ncbi:MAG: tripartite tricarboxylate transporter substrate binding protein, partial [Deltaproteobacteria bacterium]|nr:tripartite tricarboxylate transporter substrate binding protein [Deltaproteobacteria bacterium]
MKKQIVCAFAAMTAMLLSAVSIAAAAAYPVKPIQLVVGFPPGGGNDVSARIIVEYANKSLPQPLVVTNVTGGTGSVAAKQVLRAKPDGYV